jgi:protein-disulfide isomerase
MNRIRPAALSGLSLALAVLFAAPTGAQNVDEMQRLRRDVESIKESQQQIRKDLDEIKALLRGRVAAPADALPDAPLAVKGEMFKGQAGAKLTLIEFSDYQCPFCARHTRDTMPHIVREYVDAGKVKYVFRDFPIESIHPQAFRGHEAARCAGEQGKFWEMQARLFANQRAMAPADLSAHAQALGVDAAKFDACLASGRYAAKVRKDITDAAGAGVRGTPTFYLGLTQPNEAPVKAVKVIRGAQPWAAFKQAIDELLADK